MNEIMLDVQADTLHVLFDTVQFIYFATVLPISRTPRYTHIVNV